MPWTVNKMSSDIEPQTSIVKSVDSWVYKQNDRVAYAGIGVYSLLNIIWVLCAFHGAGFFIFDTAGLVGLFAPLLGLFTLVMYQSLRRNNFSMLANVISIAAIGGWFVFVWHIVAAASAAV